MTRFRCFLYLAVITLSVACEKSPAPELGKQGILPSEVWVSPSPVGNYRPVDAQEAKRHILGKRIVYGPGHAESFHADGLLTVEGDLGIVLEKKWVVVNDAFCIDPEEPELISECRRFYVNESGSLAQLWIGKPPVLVPVKIK
jgi:hypothetical protein